MIGRAAIGYPWIFNEIKHFMATGELMAAPTLDQRLEVCRKHLDFSIEWKGDRLGIYEMRRHYSNYFRGFHSFKDFRMQLVQADSHDEMKHILENVREYYSQRVSEV